MLIATNQYVYTADKTITRREGTAKQTMNLHTERKRTEQAELLKRKLAENTEKMKLIKKQKLTVKSK